MRKSPLRRRRRRTFPLPAPKVTECAANIRAEAAVDFLKANEKKEEEEEAKLGHVTFPVVEGGAFY